MSAHNSASMPDDCPVSDESRRALRDLARRAEWRGRAGAAGAALDARTLRELGREIENALALATEPDRETWGHRASESLAACCQRAQPDWTPEQIAELNRLRDDALTALAPGPGEAEAAAEAATQAAASRRPTSRLTLSSLTSRRPATIALAVVACIVLIALVLALPHFLSNDSAQTPTASATTTAIPTTPTAAASAAQSASATSTTESATTTATTSTSTAASASPSAVATTSSASTSNVTGIQISPDVVDGDPPEVIVTANVNASGIGDVAIYFTITGSSGQPQVVELDESGQTSYEDLTQQINLSQWCGQSSVKLTVSSGAVSQSAPIAISGC